MQQGPRRKPFRARLRVDSEFFLDLSICWEFHIPHSEFLEWEPEDRAKVVAYYMEKNARCQMCGTAEWEWDPEQGGNKFAYEAVETQCPGCLRKSAVQETSGSKHGVTVILQPTNTVEHARRQKRAEEIWLSEMRRKANRDGSG